MQTDAPAEMDKSGFVHCGWRQGRHNFDADSFLPALAEVGSISVLLLQFEVPGLSMRWRRRPTGGFEPRFR